MPRPKVQVVQIPKAFPNPYPYCFPQRTHYTIIPALLVKIQLLLFHKVQVALIFSELFPCFSPAFPPVFPSLGDLPMDGPTKTPRLFVRHGQYDLDTEEHGLTELGRKQSELLAQRLVLERLTPKKDRGPMQNARGWRLFGWDMSYYVYIYIYICTYLFIPSFIHVLIDLLFFGIDLFLYLYIYIYTPICGMIGSTEDCVCICMYR